MLTLFIIYVVAGALLSYLAQPLIRQKVKPNPFYGFRVSGTLDDQKAWYAVNKYAGKWLFWTGVIVVVAATGLFIIPGIGITAYALGVLAVFAVVLGAGLAQSFHYLKTYKKKYLA